MPDEMKQRDSLDQSTDNVRRYDTGGNIVNDPIRPGLLRICFHCGGFFAIKYIRSEKDEVLGELKYYRCRKCGKEVVFCRHKPPGVL